MTKPRKRKEATGAPPAALSEVVDALMHVSAETRETWLKVGMALQYDHGEDGRELWDVWSEGNRKPDGSAENENYPPYEGGKFDPDDQERVWQSFDDDCGDPVTCLSIFDLARKNGWKGFKADPADEFEPIDDDGGEQHEAAGSDREEATGATEPEGEALLLTRADTPYPPYMDLTEDDAIRTNSLRNVRTLLRWAGIQIRYNGKDCKSIWGNDVLLYPIYMFGQKGWTGWTAWTVPVKSRVRERLGRVD